MWRAAFRLPGGETRLLAYALDEKITIERDVAQADRLARNHRAGLCSSSAHHTPDHNLPLCAARPKNRASS